MIVVEKIIMQRRDPNGSQKEYHKSDRIATAMCDAAGSDAEYAGMAVYTPHGGRGRSAAGRREKPSHGRKERLPQRLSSTPLGYPNGHNVPHGVQGSSGRLHSVLRHRTQAQWSDARTGGSESLRARWSTRKWRSWRIASALKIYPEARSAR